MDPSCSSTGVGAGERYSKLCFHWQAGYCNRHPCSYLHTEIPNSLDTAASSKRSNHQNPSQGQVTRNPNTAAGIGGPWSKLYKGRVGHVGHQKVITGIAFPSGSDKLYSGSKDDTVRVWNC